MKKKKIIFVVFIVNIILIIIFTIIIALLTYINVSQKRESKTLSEEELYKKWNEEQKEYDRKNNIVNDLLNKYYPKEKNVIDEMNLKEIEETGRTNVATSRSKRKSNKESRINSKIM